ncbi:polar-differentiation response regulator DivK [bacterium BMS3Abin04]|nr:polar-differentiation response regulator DivK [bacterium BMS3Abin04]
MNENEKYILIIEDDYFTNEFYRVLFRKVKYPFIQSENGEDILNILSQKEISLIILDINLKNTLLDKKKIDGLELSKYIKENFNSSSIPILLVTAYRKNSNEDNFLEKSLADDYITKPITDLNVFLEKVKMLKLK